MLSLKNNIRMKLERNKSKKLHVNFSNIYSILIRQCGPGGKSAVLLANVTEMVQNLIGSFCCVLGKDTSRNFTLLGSFSKQL